ncbi:MAG: hypothetical protein ACRCTS_10225 [Fusobacteriaceae bacterium]
MNILSKAIASYRFVEYRVVFQKIEIPDIEDFYNEIFSIEKIGDEIISSRCIVDEEKAYRVVFTISEENFAPEAKLGGENLGFYQYTIK